LDNLPETGRLLDIGAYNGITFSNSKALMDKGWSGVLVEPCADVFVGLAQAYKGNDKGWLVNAAVSPNHTGLIKFYSTPDAVSTTEHTNTKAHLNKWGQVIQFQEIYTTAIGVADFFSKFGYDFDFITLDVESLNVELFLAIPWQCMTNLKLLCIEHDGNTDLISERMPDFETILINGENIILRRKS